MTKLTGVCPLFAVVEKKENGSDTFSTDHHPGWYCREVTEYPQIPGSVMGEPPSVTAVGSAIPSWVTSGMSEHVCESLSTVIGTCHSH